MKEPRGLNKFRKTAEMWEQKKLKLNRILAELTKNVGNVGNVGRKKGQNHILVLQGIRSGELVKKICFKSKLINNIKDEPATSADEDNWTPEKILRTTEQTIAASELLNRRTTSSRNGYCSLVDKWHSL